MPLKNKKMRFIDLCSEFTPNNVPNKAIYDLNDPSGVNISEAEASVISDIILDYVKSQVKDAYITQNTKQKRIRSSTLTPNFFRHTAIKNSKNYFEAIVTLEQHILVVIVIH
jgi:hypothetical protein